MTNQDQSKIKLSQVAEDRASALITMYPDKCSAVMPLLYIGQEEKGFISDEVIHWVAGRLDMAPVHVREVATFYTMYYKKPVGKYHFQVCRTLSCAIRGSKALVEHLKSRFGIDPDQVSADGKWSYEQVECLGSCGSAPMCEINDTYFENLTVEKLEEIIKNIEKDQPDLRFSTIKDELGAGLKAYPKSEVGR